MSFEEPQRKPSLVLTKKIGGWSSQKKKRSIAKSNPFKNCMVEDLAGAQIKRTKLMIEADKKRDELFLKHRADETQRTREYRVEEASKNREHKLRLAQIYASI